jgi:MinD-like ATPase involved in chromosome partitioning or flagellar assembly
VTSREPQRLTRSDVYPGAFVDGRETRTGPVGRVGRRLDRLLVSQGEREEASVEHAIVTQPGVTRPNAIALLSPKGGVGKTTSTFLVGNLLASQLKLRAVAVDANPDFGTLARLTPERRRSSHSLVDVLEANSIETAAELRTFVTCLPTGLHVLAAPPDATLTASLGPDRYGELVAFLSKFYDVVLLDLGTGVAGELAQFAIDRADQMVLVTTPEYVTSEVVLQALDELKHGKTTVVLNKIENRGDRLRVFEERFRDAHLHRVITVPHDDQLAGMLDTGTYALDALKRPTRLAIKRLGLAVAEQLA